MISSGDKRKLEKKLDYYTNTLTESVMIILIKIIDYSLYYIFNLNIKEFFFIKKTFLFITNNRKFSNKKLLLFSFLHYHIHMMDDRTHNFQDQLSTKAKLSDSRTIYTKRIVLILV